MILGMACNLKLNHPIKSLLRFCQDGRVMTPVFRRLMCAAGQGAHSPEATKRKGAAKSQYRNRTMAKDPAALSGMDKIRRRTRCSSIG